MKIYTAGPITGLSYAEVMARYNKQSTMFKEFGYSVYCPMTGKEHLRNERNLKADFSNESKTHPTATNNAIKGRDKWMVEQVDIVFVDFTDSNGTASIGSCMEMAWADEFNKHVVAVIPEGDIHNHAFVLQCADIVFKNREDAYSYLESLIKSIK